VPSYTVGYIDVYRNGVKLGTADFTATSGTSVVLASGATAGDLVETISFFVSSVLNAIPAVANAVTTSYINDGAVTKAKMAASGAWAPAGTVVQMVNAEYNTQVVIASTSFTDTGLSATITPLSASNKILVMWNVPAELFVTDSSERIATFQTLRASTEIDQTFMSMQNVTRSGQSVNAVLVDSPSTTSSVTYKIQAKVDSTSASCGVTVQRYGLDSNIVIMEIAA
jgi:hypothetical protein